MGKGISGQDEGKGDPAGTAVNREHPHASRVSLSRDTPVIGRIQLQAFARELLGGELLENRHYGHDGVLKAYAGVRLPYIIPGRMQHGWTAGAGISGDPATHGRAERSIRHFVWNKHNLERALQLSYTNATAIGAPFVYLQSEPSHSRSSPGEKSLLLFPMHTWEGEPFLDPVRTYTEYLAEIGELRSSFSPVTVCLYWIQYADPAIVRLFEREEISVVTLGPRNSNPSFLRMFHDLCAQYAYVSSNHFSTAVFYALYMRKKVFLFGKSRFAEIAWFPRNLGPPQRDLPAVYPQLLWPNFDDKSYYWIGEEELGLEFKRSPTELRELFGWNAANFPKQRLEGSLFTCGRLARWSLRELKRTVGSRRSGGSRRHPPGQDLQD